MNDMGSDRSAGQPRGSFSLFSLGFENGELGGSVDNIFFYGLYKQIGKLSQQEHTSPLLLRMTQRREIMAMCHPAPTLQIAQHAGPNYNSRTNGGHAQTHMIRRSLPEQSNLRCYSSDILLNGLPASAEPCSLAPLHLLLPR